MLFVAGDFLQFMKHNIFQSYFGPAYITGMLSMLKICSPSDKDLIIFVSDTRKKRKKKKLSVMTHIASLRHSLRKNVLEDMELVKM